MLLAGGVLVLMVFHTGALDRLRHGESYLLGSPRAVGFALAGLVAAGCGFAVLVRAAEPSAPKPPTRAFALAALVLLFAASALSASIGLAFYTGLEADLFLRVVAAVSLAVLALAFFAFGRPLVQLALGGAPRVSHPGRGLRIALALAPALAVFSMAHGCGYPGCNGPCTALTYGAAGLAALGLLQVSSAGSTLPLVFLAWVYAVPHCICANPINAPWIALLGVSPNCFAFAMIAAFFAVAGLAGIRPRVAALFAFAPALASAAFAFGHHVLRYPW